MFRKHFFSGGLVVAICLLILPSTEAQDRPFPQMAELRQATKTGETTLPKGTKVAVLAERESQWVVAYPSQTSFLISRKNVKGTLKSQQGVVLTNRSPVRSVKNNQIIGFLHRGDMLFIEKQVGSFWQAKSPHLIRITQVPRPKIHFIDAKVPERWMATILPYMEAHRVPPVWKAILALQKKLERELQKSLEEMDLKPLVLECVSLSRKTKNPTFLATLEGLKSRALEAERARQEYLRLTAPLRNKIQNLR